MDRYLQCGSLKRSSESRNIPVSIAAENITSASGFTNTGSSKPMRILRMLVVSQTQAQVVKMLLAHVQVTQIRFVNIQIHT